MGVWGYGGMGVWGMGGIAIIILHMKNSMRSKFTVNTPRLRLMTSPLFVVLVGIVTEQIFDVLNDQVYSNCKGKSKRVSSVRDLSYRI